jgi:hypothetical protein
MPILQSKATGYFIAKQEKNLSGLYVFALFSGHDFSRAGLDGTGLTRAFSSSGTTLNQ